MMRWGIIATWYFSKEGVWLAANLLSEGKTADEAVKVAIHDVENNPRYKSVGYGGLPNQEGVCEFDAGWMNGDTLGFGAVGAVKDIKNVIDVAEKLSHQQFNAFLVGAGAEQYAHLEGFERKNMLTEKAMQEYRDRKSQIDMNELTSYDGHDTVSMVCVDQLGTTIAATSTSGLFMKKPGRVGDSPIIGSGFYADSDIGGGAATGVGEDIMKGCLSYEVTSLMEQGLTPMEACEKALKKFERKLIKKRGKASPISIVAMNKECEWGIATNIEFTFVVATHDHPAKTYVAEIIDGETVIRPVEDVSKWAMNEEHKLD
ncbi:N(4)-(beta-N-acetylglucosaminyl)-L-asparaginase [Turicibacter sanguinis]|uniref:N(4)-(beta-N-acetylglucosaminyl)-L-asparaginase n=2 Tax=Turicibacter sanguinis TaxID=154288 RepID=UPI0018ABF3B9|nr:N(4)-(beta-N-acetylglucosaminyl)-L-asparaginase [Turicibacter sanguinis]MDB8551365.1 N(4)-(beta-N-acetylglucosaminyl)-L-asparaginase [Turicibacter sanguinis]